MCAFAAYECCIGSKRVRGIRTPVWSPCSQWVAGTQCRSAPSLWVWQPGTGESSAYPVPEGHEEDVLCWCVFSMQWLAFHVVCISCQCIGSGMLLERACSCMLCTELQVWFMLIGSIAVGTQPVAVIDDHDACCGVLAAPLAAALMLVLVLSGPPAAAGCC